jgi:hypothetical protein
MEDLYQIKKIVENIWGVEDISTKTKTRNVFGARVAYVQLARMRTKNHYSYDAIGRIIKRDHSSIYHCLKLHDQYMSFDKTYVKKFQDALEIFEDCLDVIRLKQKIKHKTKLIKELKSELNVLMEEASKLQTETEN